VGFGQTAQPKNSRVHRHVGLGLLLEGGQDIADDPVDGGGRDAVLGEALALVSLQVGPVQVGQLAEGAAGQVPVPETLEISQELEGLQALAQGRPIG
jgi:hypothetical protein